MSHAPPPETGDARDSADTALEAVKPTGPLRHGWTTGACAAAAAKAAVRALITGDFPDPVEIPLPRGQRPAFALATQALGLGWASAGVIKDAGDDPDVTHGVLVRATVRPGPAGSGVVFAAGEGVGRVTKPGLPVAVGEPAINPGPRAMILEALAEGAGEAAGALDLQVEIAIPGGADIAVRTLNPRLGIVGGLSVLGTTGVVVPFSCAAWIHTIHRGIDVARAEGLEHVAGATGSTSEAAVAAHHALPDSALIDMGDFVGGMLKYLRRHPVPRVTVAGGVAKMTKLAQGFLDLHSRRGRVDMAALAAVAQDAGADADLAHRIETANTAAMAFDLARAAEVDLGGAIAAQARTVAQGVVADSGIAVEVLLFDRNGRLVGTAPFAHATAPSETLAEALVASLPEAAPGDRDGRKRRS